MRVLKTTAAVLFLVAILMAVFDGGVHSQNSLPTLPADQANVAATRDATWTPGSVSLEGVPANDRTTYTFRTNVNPPAAGGPQAIAPGSGISASSSLLMVEPVLIDDGGGGGGGGGTACPQPLTADAPTGFDDKTNGFIPQGTPVPDCTDPTPGTFLHDKAIFEEIETIDDGLGPIYNDKACASCHDNPVTGAISQIMELRAGHTIGTTFFDAPGGSLINQRGIPTPNYNGSTNKSAKVQERVPPLYTAGIIGGGPAITAEEPTRTLRTTLNTLGDGFVEAIADGTLVAIANNQPGTTGNQVHGLVINVPVLEANFQTNPECLDPNLPCIRRVGRFGWKNQHGSLLSFSGDAYLNETGITNFLALNENTSLGRFIGFGTLFDIVPDNTVCQNSNFTCGEDVTQDIKVFTEFMRATKAPPRDPDIIAQFLTDVNAGASLFETMVFNGISYYSCSVCHVPSIVTAPNCTVINGGTFTLTAPLANKVIRPFSDFLLHDVGTGDGIVQNGGQITRTTVRTPPLWGVRTRNQLMHDGTEETFNEAILRHSGEAAAVIGRYQLLTPLQKRQLITFLESL
jgi:CxxC motif-containing protein (DUF1111 family)